MTITLPPILEREMRIASRRGATYWSRAGAAAAGIIIACLVLMAQPAAGPPASAGRFAFRVLAAIAAFVAVGSVLEHASRAFAREKREDTLGLLFLTPLKPVDLVIGKLASTSLLAFYRFLAIVPLLSLPVLLGGVTFGNFVALVISVINWIFLAATCGLYVSARSWDEKRAATLATSVMFGLAAAPAILFPIGALLRQPGWYHGFAISPAYPIWHATVPGGMHTVWFWLSLLWTHLLGWFFFHAACRTLPRCWQDRPIQLGPTGEHLQHNRPIREASAASTSVLNARIDEFSGNRWVRRQFSRDEQSGMLDRNPVLWLAARWRPRFSSAWVAGSLGLVVVSVLFTTGLWRHLHPAALALFVCYCVNVALKNHAATQASRAFARDSREDPLELLLSTPVKSMELAEGYFESVWQSLRRVVIRVLWIEGATMALAIANHTRRPHPEEIVVYIVAAGAIMGFLIPDLRALIWVALWRGVISRNAREALQEASSRVLSLPGLAVIFVWVVAAPIGAGVVGLVAGIVAWIVASIVANRWFSDHARRQLETQMRLWAMRRAAGELEHHDGWRRFGRLLGLWWGRRYRPA